MFYIRCSVCTILVDVCVCMCVDVLVAKQPMPESQPPRFTAPPNPGKIADFDPLQGRGGGPHTPYSARQSSTVIYTSERGPGNAVLHHS